MLNHLTCYCTRKTRELHRSVIMLIYAVLIVFIVGRGAVVAEVYDVTTVYKFVAPYSDIHDEGPLISVPPCDLNGSGCFEWNVNGWENTNLGQIKIDRPFSVNKYEVLDGGITTIVPVPSEEFVISFRSSGAEIYIFLLADDDVIESDMIILVLSRAPYANICQKNRDGEHITLPNKSSRKCSSTTFSYDHEYAGSNNYSSLFVKQSPELQVLMPDDLFGSNLLTKIFSKPYQIEKFVIKFVAIGVTSESAIFQLWPSFRTLRLSQYQGVMSTEIAEKVEHDSLVCLSLKYYLQPNSGALIKVLMENMYDELIVLGTITAPHGDIQVASMTTQQFISKVKPYEWTHGLVKFKILAERSSSLDIVLLSAVNECHDTEFPDFKTINERGTAEIHAMTNARGLPLLLHSDMTAGSFVGVNMEKCIALNGGCDWTISNWTRKSVMIEENLPLKMSGNKKFVEYTVNNISKHHIFYRNKLHFTFKVDSGSSDVNLGIFLMGSNPNIMSGDMYYIKLMMRNSQQSYYNNYDQRYRKSYYELRKCTLQRSGHSTSIPGETDQRVGCELMLNGDVSIDENHVCDFTIQFSAGLLTVTSACDSEKHIDFKWTDRDPLDVVYYRFGTWQVKSEFHVHIDSPFVWSLTSEEGSLTSPAFVPSSSILCVSLTYYIELTLNNSLELSVHWPDGDRLDFNSIQATGKWETVRLTATLLASKLGKQMTVELKGRMSKESDVLIQRIAGCNGEGSEDVLVLSDSATVNIQNTGYDVAVARSRNTNYFSSWRNFPSAFSEVSCMNGGVFDEERGSCVCPAGFTGSTCNRGCGVNRFGAACDGLCSKTKQGCKRMVLCRPTLGCSCASGLKGILCDKNCDYLEYGAGCKQKCGYCKNQGECDKYTGECPLGCDPGYYPPFCQQTYKRLSKAPDVSAADVQAIIVSANLRNTKGEGTPTFYQFQYRENSSLWQELGILPISSNFILSNITELKSGTNYQVRVVLLDKDGSSYQGSDVPYTDVTTQCTVPDSVDYDLQANEISEDSYQISWKFDPKSPMWCPVTEFEVEDKDGPRWLKIYQGKEMTVKLSNLLPGQEYQIRVRALASDRAFPFSDVLLFTTEVGAPEKVRDVRIVSRLNHELEVNWTPPMYASKNIHRYKVSYQCQKLLACKSEDCSYSAGEVEVTAPPIVLHELLSYAQYSISVAALAASWGPTEQSLAVTGMTVPNVAPEPNSTSPVTHRTNSSFVVHWKPLQNCTFLNGYLYRYRFELTSQNNSKWLREGTTRLTSANFTDLTPHTMYIVRVYLVTSGGWNTNYPLKIPANTRATTPDPVEQLMVYKKGRRMLGLRWAAPKQTYGSLKSFTISYQMPGQNKRNVKSKIKPAFCPAWPHLYCHALNGLQPDTVYTVLVQAQNVEVDEAGETALVTAVTKETAPISPSYIHVVNQTQTTITIEWGLPDMVNGVLRSFLVNIEEVDSFNSTECCQYFPVQEVTVKSEKSNYRFELNGLQPASSYAISVSAKTVTLGPAISITAHTRPPIPVMDSMIEIPTDLISLSDNSITVLIHPSTEYKDLIRGYLMLVLPESNGTLVPKTVFFDDWLTQEVQDHVKGTYYFAAEFDQMDLEENPEVTVGSGLDLKVGKWGEMQNPELENLKHYSLGLILVLEYCGVYSVGYTETRVLHARDGDD